MISVDNADRFQFVQSVHYVVGREVFESGTDVDAVWCLTVASFLVGMSSLRKVWARTAGHLAPMQPGELTLMPHGEHFESCMTVRCDVS